MNLFHIGGASLKLRLDRTCVRSRAAPAHFAPAAPACASRECQQENINGEKFNVDIPGGALSTQTRVCDTLYTVRESVCDTLYRHSKDLSQTLTGSLHSERECV